MTIAADDWAMRATTCAHIWRETGAIGPHGVQLECDLCDSECWGDPGVHPPGSGLYALRTVPRRRRSP